MKNTKILVKGTQIGLVLRKNNNDYISLTDMAKFKDRELTGIVIAN